MLTIQGSVDSVAALSTTNLTATYANGTSGVGATLTSTTNTALIVDNYTASVGDRILINGQTASLQNGIYAVTAAGSSSAPWVLTRSTDFNGSSSTKQGIYVFVIGGVLNANTGWIEANTGTGSNGALTVGTDSISFVSANTVPYQFLPGANVYVVNASVFGIAKATVSSISMSQTTSSSAALSYNVTYSNSVRTAGAADSSTVFATVEAALAAYQPLIT